MKKKMELSFSLFQKHHLKIGKRKFHTLNWLRLHVFASAILMKTTLQKVKKLITYFIPINDGGLIKELIQSDFWSQVNWYCYKWITTNKNCLLFVSEKPSLKGILQDTFKKRSKNFQLFEGTEVNATFYSTIFNLLVIGSSNSDYQSKRKSVDGETAIMSQPKPKKPKSTYRHLRFYQMFFYI